MKKMKWNENMFQKNSLVEEILFYEVEKQITIIVIIIVIIVTIII